MNRTVVIGAGPAGLTAAWELAKLDLPAIVLEKDPVVGGISRTVHYQGYRFDLGGHRFFTKVELVRQVWEELLGEDLLERPRLSRIFYQNHFFDYPLRPLNALTGLGPVEATRIGASYLAARLFPTAETNFEQWVVNRFGRRLFEIFFETYTEKVWGIPCSEIGAEWASQRIKNLDLATALRNALLGQASKKGEVVTTLIDSFHYPRHGPGMMWERCRDRLAEQGIETHLRSEVCRIEHDNRRIVGIEVEGSNGDGQSLRPEHVISSMPISSLLFALDPPPPPEVMAAARSLRYRDFMTVGLIVDRPNIFPDNWIYIHAPEVKMGRIQNFKNWSPDMVPDSEKTSLGLEYFVQQGDSLWESEDSDLIELGERECLKLGLLDSGEVLDGIVIRVPKAYPVYDEGYQEALKTLRSFIETFENLQTVGRNGQHRYNNQDHSMLTGILAARNIAGASHDVWAVNVDSDYHEEASQSATGAGDRATPGTVNAAPVDELMRSAFARYDPVALGGAIGATGALGLFLATALLLLKGGSRVGMNLSLLGNYLVGFNASWQGAVIGAAEAGIGGFGLGWVLAKAINVQVGWHEASLRRRLEATGAMELFESGNE